MLGNKFFQTFLKWFILPLLLSLNFEPIMGQENKNDEFVIEACNCAPDLNRPFILNSKKGPRHRSKKKHHRHRCKHHCRGKRGPAGPTGPTGPSGPTFATFISLYALNSQAVNVGAPILFDALSARNGPITWPGANNGEIVIGKAGTYKISFGIQLLFSGRISLQINNVNVPGGTLSADLSLILPVLEIDVQIPIGGARITLVNTGTLPFTLVSAGPDPSATIAFIEVHQIL